MRLTVVRMRRWAPPPERDILTVAKAASHIRGRDEVDLTMVCLGPPAPTDYWEGGYRVLGYARVLANLVVTKVMNAHVFVHEIGHVLGAVHIDQPGCIMVPNLEGYSIDERARALPPMVFSPLNRNIIDVSRDLPLGKDYQDHLTKLEGMIDAYEQLRSDHVADIAPNYGHLLLNLGRFDDAIALLEEARTSRPNDLIVLSMLKEALQNAGRIEEAQEIVQENFDMRQAGLHGRTAGRLALKKLPEISVSSSFIVFSQLSVGTRETKKVVISNVGTGVLDVSQVELMGNGFTLLDGDGGLVQPGESLEVRIVFEPTLKGSFQGTVEISSDDRRQRTVPVRISGEGL